ncbi:phospholipid methyltransferase family protein [Tieghemostelium lacteum]|uniref:Phosphatidylethanolamine N-methyltransferase n=1 Tax=Tieghemostelium lacteum TaxID=361077 RepID=A0A152A9N5_TIELA|nr:phospholipid methyltransferase family protein [Tieghemostelium lacteum]|eukprot:KYR02845.1 phospholipid methyltransferase family protein [Tieghemostelium lacteum]
MEGITLDYLSSFIDFSETYFWLAIGCIIFNPLWWNIQARYEYNHKFLTRLMGGQYAGCYLMAFLIFSLGILRDYLFAQALMYQPIFEEFGREEIQYLAYALYAIGSVLVLSAYMRLGITGTYLGDYFGILMSARVTGFPFNVMNNPMYNGSTMLFLAHALSEKSLAGVFITIVVYVVYQIALIFEGSFTDFIYCEANKNNKKTK